MGPHLCLRGGVDRPANRRLRKGVGRPRLPYWRFAFYRVFAATVSDPGRCTLSSSFLSVCSYKGGRTSSAASIPPLQSRFGPGAVQMQSTGLPSPPREFFFFFFDG